MLCSYTERLSDGYMAKHFKAPTYGGIRDAIQEERSGWEPSLQWKHGVLELVLDNGDAFYDFAVSANTGAQLQYGNLLYTGVTRQFTADLGVAKRVIENCGANHQARHHRISREPTTLRNL